MVVRRAFVSSCCAWFSMSTHWAANIFNILIHGSLPSALRAGPSVISAAVCREWMVGSVQIYHPGSALAYVSESRSGEATVTPPALALRR